MSAAEASAAMASYRVNFINKDDARRVLLPLLKQVAHPRRAHADEHFHKVRAGNRKEWNISFSRDRPRQQSLARSRRPHQQHAFWNPAAQLLEFLGLAQELDNLPQ